MKANFRLLSGISPLTVIALEPEGPLLEAVHIHTKSKEKQQNVCNQPLCIAIHNGPARTLKGRAGHMMCQEFLQTPVTY